MAELAFGSDYQEFKAFKDRISENNFYFTTGKFALRVQFIPE